VHFWSTLTGLMYLDKYEELGINIMVVLTIFECFSCILECAFDEGAQVMTFFEQ